MPKKKKRLSYKNLMKNIGLRTQRDWLHHMVDISKTLYMHVEKAAASGEYLGIEHKPLVFPDSGQEYIFIPTL